MDMEQLKSEEQMEMMMMMMMMEKVVPDFCGPQNDVAQLPPSSSSAAADVCGAGAGTSSTSRVVGNYIENSSVAAPASFPKHPTTTAISFDGHHQKQQQQRSMAAMREMIFRIAAMQPIHIDPEAVKPPKRRNVRISKDPQSVAARHRRERISERIRILQRLVPGGTKMDTASMLDEAIHYVKFLKSQVQSLQRASAITPPPPPPGIGFPVPISTNSYLTPKPFQLPLPPSSPPPPPPPPLPPQNVHHFGDSS